MYLKENLEFFLHKKGVELDEFLLKNELDSLSDFSIGALEEIASHYDIVLRDLLFTSLFQNSEKLEKIKFLILDVDGVMTDGGMYFTENGDQIKKYNTKDGMAIMHLIKRGYQVGIISSGFKVEMVKSRADLLGIQHFYVGRDRKINVLRKWCAELNISLNEVAMIGDDINDLELMENIGISACPNDAVDRIKNAAQIHLKMKGGKACVREFIDNYLLKEAI